MKIRHLFAVLTLLLLVSGCVVRQGDFTVLSDKLIDAQDFDLSNAHKTKHVEGKDVSHIIVFFPTKGAGSLEDAISDALAKGEGDVLTDATVYSYYWYIPYIYGQQGWRVEGDVVKTRPE